MQTIGVPYLLESQSILCFAPGPWHDLWRNRHQILSRLAQWNRVLYVEPRSYLRPVWRQIRRGRFDWRSVRQPGLETVAPNLWVHHTPTWAPRSDRTPLGSATKWARDTALRRAIRHAGLHRPLLWLFLPDQGDLIGRFQERLVIYHAVDEYTGYDGVRDALKPVLREMEIDIMRRADLVFVTSPNLFEAKRPYNPHTYHVPNAVDYAAFARVLDADTLPPADVASLPRPLIGYVGAINDKLDLGLIRAVAQAVPDGSVILVGAVRSQDEDGLRALNACPNVHFLGLKPVDRVPHYIKASAVCLLPYRMNEWTRHIDSLKLYEYLACGKPVVAVDLPTVRPFADLLWIAGDAESFTRAVRKALREDDLAVVSQRRARAQNETWDRRVATLSAYIEAALSRREGARA